MKHTIKVFTIAYLVTSWAVVSADAADVKFEAAFDRSRAAIGETVQLGLSFYGTQSMPAPDISNVSGLEIRYLGPSTMMTVINGRVSSSVTHMYSVLPLKIAKFQLGPFSFKYKGNTYTSNMVFLEVVEEKAAPVRVAAPVESDTIEKLNLEDRIFLVLKVGKSAAYVNELVPVTIKLYVNRMNASDIQLPTFDQEGFSKIEFKEPKQYREEYGQAIYDVLEFKTQMFGTRPGNYRVGPARIKCNLMAIKQTPRDPMRNDIFGDDPRRDSFFDDFFTRYEKHPIELKSQDAQLIISPLPAENRPQDFTGAVGDYQFIYKASPTKVKAGDPISLNMEINGSGNFNTVLMPKIENITGFKIYEPQVRTGENTKSFKVVLIPENDRVKDIPKAVFNYFDPNEKVYRSISQGPIAIQVEKGSEEAPAQIVGPISSVQAPQKEDILARDIIYIKEAPGRWRKIGRNFYKSKPFIFAIALPLLVLLFLYLVQERRDRLRRDTIRASRINAFRSARKGLRGLKRALKKPEPKAFYETIFKNLQDYLGIRFCMPTHGITADVAERALTSRDVDAGMLKKVKDLFEVCDRARFAFFQADNFKMQDDLKELEEVINYLERKKL
ncbi:MAG: BatD family protein [Candidatus Omnitrophota bacterium]|nr:BatD family protein [Candidatus Omnitrophota bacterium]